MNNDNNNNDDDTAYNNNNNNYNYNYNYGTGLPHAQECYDNDDCSTDEGMHRIKPGH